MLQSQLRLIKIDTIKKNLDKFPIMDGLELASKVSTKKSYEIGDSNSQARLAVIDLGIKKIFLKIFQEEVYL